MEEAAKADSRKEKDDKDDKDAKTVSNDAAAARTTSQQPVSYVPVDICL